MNLTELRPLWAAPLKDTNIPRDNAIADRYLNLAYIEIFESHRWANRKKTGSLTLIPNLTGNCSVTIFTGSNESLARTVVLDIAGSDALLGRFFRAKGSSYWHKIISYSGNTLYLDSPVIDASGGVIYEIWKRFYYLKSDADVLLDFDNWTDDRINYRSEAGLVDSVTDPSQTGNPYLFSPFGVDPYDDVQYITGTVSGSKDSNIITGSGTTFLSSGFDTGDILEANSKEYFIKRIESDTKIILFNSLIDDLALGNFKLKKYNPYGFQFYNTPTAFKIIPYTYMSRAYPLIHPTLDKIQLQRRFIPAIVSRAQYFRMIDTDDSRATTKLQIYSAELDGLKAKVETISARYDIFAPKIPAFMPGRG